MPSVKFAQATVRTEDRRANRQRDRREDRRTDWGDRGRDGPSSETNGVRIEIPTPLCCARPQTSSDAACPGHHASHARYGAMRGPVRDQSGPVRPSSRHHRPLPYLPSY